MMPRRTLPALLLGMSASVQALWGSQAQAQTTPPAAPPAVPPPAAPSATPAEAPLVERKVFESSDYATRGGATVGRLRVGYQVAGTLNATGDNAVLLCHSFLGNGQAFGRTDREGTPGWWDSIIGPGRPIDTDRYFVVSSDVPASLHARDTRITATGPTSVDPSTGRPYGMSFPVLSIRDFVEVQKLLLDSLGVKALAMVGGPAMGAMQAIEWAAAYPQMVRRVVAAVPTGAMDAYLQGWMEVWEAPIRNDPNWRGGEYYAQGREPPTRGLTDALRILMLQTRDRGDLARFNRQVPEGQEPAKRIGDTVAVDRFLLDAAAARARVSDANSFLYLTRAMQLFLNEYPDTAAALARSQAAWLVLPATGDRVFPVEYGRELARQLEEAKRPVVLRELGGDRGHNEGTLGIEQAAEAIRSFLAQPAPAP
ncbi:alpha/beta fold hydrolase [Roseomonas elaeocarpi]|uniref:Probable acyltransferase n=1 Tax=Roseomonas elaeocarpi TaxID=907779 RepID=A0ABV6JU55_9PROT